MKPNRTLRLSAIGSIAVITVALSVAPAPASTELAPDPVLMSDSQDIPAGTTITLPDGSHVVLPEDWSDLSVKDLAELGIYPGMGPSASSSFVGVSAQSAPAAFLTAIGGGVTPNSAQGCNVNVCMQLYGVGLTISNWNTQAQLDITMCSFAVYWAAGAIFRTTNNACGSAGSLLRAYGTQTTWPNNTVLCNSWVGVVGKPCNTVHS